MAYRRYARSSRGRGYRSSPRSNIWYRVPSYTIAADAVNYAVDLTPSGAGFELDAGTKVGSTVVRIIGSLAFMMTGLGTGGKCTMGIAVSQEESNAATPEINPLDDANVVQWMYWFAFPQLSGVESATGAYRTVYSFDVKAKRRIVSPGETLNAYFHWTKPNGATALQQVTELSASILLKH